MLGGRAFAPTGASTLEHDDYVMGLVRKSGLKNLEMMPGESADKFVERLLWDLVDVRAPLLGAFLVPEGVKGSEWTPAIAAQTAAHVRGLTTETDKAATNSLTISMLIGFFGNGLATLWTTRKSSRRDRPGRKKRKG